MTEVLRCIGIDPGLRGAVATLEPEGRGGWIDRIPIVPDPMRPGRNTFDLPAMRALILERIDGHPARVVVEESPPQRSESHGRGLHIETGRAIGAAVWAWRGLLAALQIDHVLVLPHSWKRLMIGARGRGGHSKARSIEAAHAAVDGWASGDPRKTLAERIGRNDNRAEAVLLALYGWRTRRSRP